MKTTPIFFLSALVLAGCGNEYTKRKGQFIAGCMNGGAAKSICSCAFEKVNARYGDQPDSAFGAYPNESARRFVAQATVECAKGEKDLDWLGQAEARLREMLASDFEGPLPSSDSHMDMDDIKSEVSLESRENLEKAIDRYAAVVAVHFNGQEYTEHRKLVTADFDNDGRPDGAALITIEGIQGGASTAHELVLFSIEAGSYMAMDSVLIEGATDLSIGADGEMVVTTASYARHDARCCPSIQSAHRFVASNKEIVEIGD